MASTLKHVLLNTLEDLSKDQMKKFCARLLDRKGEPHVRLSAIEDKGKVEVVDVLVSTFTEAQAGGVAVELLRAIDCHDLAKNLETALTQLRERRAVPAPQPAENQEEHFVDRHRTSLIERIRLLAPILDVLLAENVVNQELYDRILATGTPQAQVRLLYSGALVANETTKKDIFLRVLEEREPLLIEDLRSGQ